MNESTPHTGPRERFVLEQDLIRRAFSSEMFAQSDEIVVRAVRIYFTIHISKDSPLATLLTAAERNDLPHGIKRSTQNLPSLE